MPIPEYCGGGSNRPISFWCVGSERSRIINPLQPNAPLPRLPPSSSFLGTYTGPWSPAKGVWSATTFGGTSFDQIHLLYSASSPLREPGTHHMETSLALEGSEASTIMLPLTNCRKYAGWWINVSSGAVSR